MTKKNHSPIVFNEFELYNLFFNDGTCIISLDFPMIFIYFLDQIAENDDKIILINTIQENKLFEDGFKCNGTVELCLDNLKHIHGQKYIKKVDDYCITETTNLDSFINENCKYSNFLADLIVKIMSIEQISYEKISEIIEVFLNVKINRKRVYDLFNRKIDEYKEKYQGQKGRTSKKDTQRNKDNKKRKQLEKELQNKKAQRRKYTKILKENDKIVKKISLIFKSKTYKTAKNRFQKLYNKINELPEEIQKYLKRLEKYLDKTLQHTLNQKIPSTNNLIEGFYKTTLPGRIKRIFKTYRGLLIRITLNNIRWINDVQQSTKTNHQYQNGHSPQAFLFSHQDNQNTFVLY